MAINNSIFSYTFYIPGTDLDFTVCRFHQPAFFFLYQPLFKLLSMWCHSQIFINFYLEYYFMFFKIPFILPYCRAQYLTFSLLEKAPKTSFYCNCTETLFLYYDLFFFVSFWFKLASSNTLTHLPPPPLHIHSLNH